MFLKKAALPAGLPLDGLRSSSQPVVEVSSECKEKRHEREDHAGQFEIQNKHGCNDKDRVENGLESIRHKTRSQFGYLVDVLLHAIQLLTHRRCFVVIRGQAVHLLQNAKPDSEDEALHRAEAYEARECGKSKAGNVDTQESRQSKKEQVEILLWQNLINEPFDQQGIKQEHQATQHDQAQAEHMGPQ